MSDEMRKIDINSVPAANSVDANDSIFISDDNHQAKRLGYNTLSGSIISQYAGESLAGTTQSVKSAIDMLGANTKRTSVEDETDLDTLVSASNGSNKYYMGLKISTMTHKPTSETQQLPFALDAIEVDGYLKQILHVYTADGTIRTYERIQYDDDGDAVFGDWEMLPSRPEIDAINTRITCATRTADLNTLTDNGYYYILDGSTNRPVAASGLLSVFTYDSVTRQVFSPNSGNTTYIRIANSNGWGAWERIATGTEISSLNVNDITIMLPNQSVDDLDTLLDGYDSSMLAGISYRGRVVSSVAHSLFGTDKYILEGYKNSANEGWQKMTSYGLDKRYFRVKGSGTWGDWQKDPTRAEVDGLNTNKYGLSYSGMVALSSNDDLDTYTSPGSFYSSTASITATLSHVPFTNSGFSLHVESVAGGTGQYIVQTIKRISDIADIYTRTYNGSTWTNWEQKPYRSEVDTLKSNASLLIGGTNLTTATDFDNLGVGNYYVFTNSAAALMSNIPVSVAGILKVESTDGATVTGYLRQTYTEYTSRESYVRVCNNGTWNSWEKKPSRSEVDTLSTNSTPYYATPWNGNISSIDTLNGMTSPGRYREYIVNGTGGLPGGWVVIDVAALSGYDNYQQTLTYENGVTYVRSHPTNGSWSEAVRLPTREEVDALKADDVVSGGHTVVPNNADMDDYYLAGVFAIESDASAATISHLPRNASGKVIVVRRGNNMAYAQQRYIPTSSAPLEYVRNYNNGTWGDWNLLPTRTEVNAKVTFDRSALNGESLISTSLAAGSYYAMQSTDAPSNASSVNGYLDISYRNNYSGTIRIHTFQPYNSTEVYVNMLQNNSTWTGWILNPTRAEIDSKPTIASGEAHNSIFRGQSLGTSVSDAQWTAISNGTFTDMYIGDYWTINNITWRIAAFNYWRNTGDNDNCNTNHVVIVPDEKLLYGDGTTHFINTSNTTAGGYVGTGFYTGTNADGTTNTAKATCISMINSAFGSSHILSHRECLSNYVYGDYVAGVTWVDSTVELMSEVMVYGTTLFEFAACGSGIPTATTIDKTQLPLFALAPKYINTDRYHWWLRSIASSQNFCFCAGGGDASHVIASYEWVGIRPCFAIK